MKNVAIIFAGGIGQRMTNATKPKQFLEVNGKPILVYTLEKFQRHDMIDSIVLVCVEDWIDYAKTLIKRFELNKVVAVIPGGANGHQSRFIGLRKVKELHEEAIILLHDGVRPLIDYETIKNSIETAKEKGSAVVSTPATETVAMDNGKGGWTIVPRENCSAMRAPQSFYLSKILALYERTENEGLDDFIDSATIMQFYGEDITIINGPAENIKITTPLDYFMFKGILETQNNKEVFGI